MASLPSDGSSPAASKVPWTNRQREESAASAGHGSLAICLLELLAAGIHWFEIYRRLKMMNMLHCSVMIFMTFSCVFMRGVPKIPLQVLPNFPHDIHDHCAGRLDGRWFTLTILPPKNMTWIYPPSTRNSGKKRSGPWDSLLNVGCSRVVTSASILETGETNQRRLSKVKPIRQTSRSFYEVGGFSDHLADAKGTYLSSKWWFLLSMNFDPISFIF